jgi:hypothetical protein
MINRTCFLLTLSGIVFMVTGCSSTPSENVKTTGISASYSVESNDGAQATCSARFFVGGSTGTVLDLTSGDSVTCNGQAMARQQDPLTHMITYSAQLAAQAGSTYTIVFTRSGEAPYNSSVVLPRSLTVTSPASGARLKKNKALDLVWNADSDSTTFVDAALSFATTSPSQEASDSKSTTTSSNLIAGRAPAPDPGALTLDAPSTAPTTMSAGDISAQLRLSRIKRGVMSNGLSGSIQATQNSSINLVLVDP